LRSVTISLPSLALLLPLAAPAAWAAECPAPHPVTGTFQVVQRTAGTVLTYPPTPSGALPANAVQVQRDVTFSGQINGLAGATGAGPMELSLAMDLVRHLASGQGYGSGEITILAQPAVPFLTAASGYKGHLDAVVTSGGAVTGYFAAAGTGDLTGTSLRGRFTGQLQASVGGGTPPGPINPFGGGDTNPFGTPPTANPFGGAPTNPLVPGGAPALPGTGGSGLRDPITGQPVGGSSTATTTPAPLEIKGGFGGASGPALLVQDDPIALLPGGDAPDLSPAATGVFPLITPTLGSFSLRLRGGQVSRCAPTGAAYLLESVETRTGATGAGTISLKAGRASATYKVEIAAESLRTVSVPAESNFGWAQAKVRLLGKKNAVVYEGTMDGTLVPLFSRGKPVANRFLWSGCMVLNQRGASGGVVDSLRCPFTATGSIAKGKVPEIQFSATLGRSEPFVRVVSGLSGH
jgi:hypothetical protein